MLSAEQKIKATEAVRRWQKAHPEKVRALCKRYRERNPDKMRALKQAWKDKNPEAQRAWTTRWNANNKAKIRANDAKREADKIQRTPSWANLKEITRIYAECPPGFHVDHEIPLRGRFVSGLHVESNLQHLPASVNIRKSNKFGDLND